MELHQFTSSDGNHEDEPKGFTVGTRIQNLTKIYNKVHVHVYTIRDTCMYVPLVFHVTWTAAHVVHTCTYTYSTTGSTACMYKGPM